MQTINASDFKARCLALLEEVATTGKGLLILKRGKPVAQVIPPPPKDDRYSQDGLMGTVTILGDVISPAFPAEDWDAEKTSE